VTSFRWFLRLYLVGHTPTDSVFVIHNSIYSLLTDTLNTIIYNLNVFNTAILIEIRGFPGREFFLGCDTV
jgi:hypothetical protein